MDKLLIALEATLRTLAGASHAARPMPTAPASLPLPELTTEERQTSAALMRINHVGEVCAQALYASQALFARDSTLRTQFAAAAKEETDHLAWTQERMDQLGGRPSLLNPLWYAGAFGIGLLAGRLGDKWSLGFVVETERQVEAHLADHLEKLPLSDAPSRAVVAQMKQDEAQHAAQALAAGGVELPAPVKWLMRGAAKVMTHTAFHI
jgi:ubiquinone biosynthesis monooxygenase Coq7